MERLVDEIGYDNWRIVYHNRLMVDLIHYLTKKEIKLLKKFKVTVKNDVYTEYEYDSIKTILAQYYVDEDMKEEEKSMQLKLKDIGVTQREYDNLLKKFDDIDKRFQKDL